MNIKFLIPAMLLSFGLISCGGGGGEGSSDGLTYDGSKAAANITPTNAKKIAISTSGGLLQAIAAAKSKDSNSARPAEVAIGQLRGVDMFRSSAAGLCDMSGSVTQYPKNDGINTVYKNCRTVIEAGPSEISYTLDGQVNFRYKLEQETLTYTLFKFIDLKTTFHGGDFDGISETVNMSLECGSMAGDVPIDACTEHSDFVGLDGRITRIAEFNVTTGVDTNVTATVFDSEFGYFQIVADKVTFNNCPYGVPDGGTITVSDPADATPDMVIIFVDCSTFTVEIGGVTTPYTWTDIIN